MSRIAVAMSGGVDSSVAAALLLAEGHDVWGVTALLTETPEAPAAVRDARAVCRQLGIPHEVIDGREVFDAEVVAPFCAAYAAGSTPNPCAVCNPTVKFGWLLSEVLSRGAEAMATGHYARIVDADGRRWIARGVDRTKDQSYFLYRLESTTLGKVLFPLGHLTKAEVREHAVRLDLHVAERPESQEGCFVGPEGHASLVLERFPAAGEPGPILDLEGARLGTHRGLAYYTVGQRKGIGVAAAEPLYVLRLDSSANALVVGPAERLRVSRIEAIDVVWPEGVQGVDVSVQTRYRMEPVPARASLADGRLSVATRIPISGVAPGQAVVCYDHERVVGGGVIESAR